MKRIIKTFETCSDELLGKLAEKFPNGIKDRHISQLTTIKGDKIRIVELQTEDTMYLIKFSQKLEDAIDNFELDIDIEDEIDIVDDVDANVVDAGEVDLEIDEDLED